jgi:hypothetical protein
LVLMPAMPSFEANSWRTKAPIDETLMKGFPQSPPKSFPSDTFLPASGAGPLPERRS